MANGRIEVITSVERRRRFSRAEKERLVSALMSPGANASEVARGAGIDRGLLYRWRRELSGLADRRGEISSFVPVSILPEPTEQRSNPPASPATVTVEFGANILLKIEGAPDTGTLAHVINVLSANVARR